MSVINRIGGGGDALRLKVRTYTELPETGEKNEIAIITETAIPRYVLAAENPFLESVGGQDIESGTVWIKTGASDVSFFADRKQTLRIDPAEVYQYIDGAWMNKNAYAFQDGAWVQFWQEQLRLYWEGYENPICGGMSTAYGTKEEDHISFRITSEGSGIEGRANTAEPVVLDSYKTLYAEVNGGDWRARNLYLGIRKTVTGSFAASVQPASDWSGTEKLILSLDISDVTGSYYCLVKNATSGVGNELHRMWLE